MNNREIVNYILSNKLNEDDVIKEIVKDDEFENGICITYIYNDNYDMWDVNGPVSIFRFTDDYEYEYTYEIITEEQAQKEIEEYAKNEKIERLRKELKELEERK